MEKTTVNVVLRGDDAALLEKIKLQLASRGDSATNAAALRHALRVAAKKAS